MVKWPSGSIFRRTFLAIYDILAEELSALNARIDVPNEVKFLILGLLDYNEKLEIRLERLEKAVEKVGIFV